MKRIVPLLLILLTSCSGLPEEGVSYSLAQERSAAISNVGYRLHFSIPKDLGGSIPAREEVTFTLNARTDVVLDFRESEDHLNGVSVSAGKAGARPVQAKVGAGHIVIPRSAVRKGENRISIDFTAGELSLNRREEFLYTLLVPDRACTLFPCFDQPDIKAHYRLSLELPQSWTAVSNTVIQSESPTGAGESQDESRKTVAFEESEPLSTYLFSFVCGKFDRVSATRDHRVVSIYHRETDAAKAAQCEGILESIFDALDYMEEYTGMPYPFGKYDCVAIPDFQYGGMEHTGATLYNDRRLFLDPSPTTAELYDRESLIAHETAHMWFGDCVTMRWFDDVWTKEVFANWFAARMTRPRFPQTNYTVSDIYNYCVPAYDEDRTEGSNAIRRPLGNLRDAGLIYCNIIYDKAPVVMEKLARRMGEDTLREGIREYLGAFKYSNATWDDLIGCLQKRATFDLREWSRVWVDCKGMPEYDASGACIDPFGEGNVWQQEVLYTQTGEGVSLPNLDGTAYGCFRLDEASARHIYAHFAEFDDTARMSLCVNLFENVQRSLIDRTAFQRWLCEALASEPDALIFSYMAECARRTALLDEDCRAAAEDALCDFVCSGASSERRTVALRALSQVCRSERVCDILYGIWRDGRGPGGLVVGESDLTSMSYQLMLRLPGRAGEIASAERGRITSADRRATFDYVSRAVSPDRAVRDSLFASLSLPEGRRPESRVRTALSLLCSPLRGEEALSRIRPALDLLPDVQRYGDIFFPSTWCKSLLSGQKGEGASAEVESWLGEHPELNPLLRTKVLQAAGALPRQDP